MKIKIANRMGSKFNYLDKILPLFPRHSTYIEPFCGMGSIFLNKELAKYNILNDYSDILFKMFMIFHENKTNMLIDEIFRTPVYEKFIKTKTDNDIKDVARYLLQQVNSMMGSGTTVRLEATNSKKNLIENLEKSIKTIEFKFSKAIICNKNCIDFLKAIQATRVNDAFIYLDPPYLKTRPFKGLPWKQENLIEVLDYLKTKHFKVAFSEYETQKSIFVEYGYEPITICKSKFTHSNSTEMLYINYKQNLLI
jgi:DNA adenine methylase